MEKIEKIILYRPCGCVITYNQIVEFDEKGIEIGRRHELIESLVRQGTEFVETKMCGLHKHFNFEIGSKLEDVILELNTYDIENGYLIEG